ncbi:MAG: ABC-F family ATP-binding cassette domain-containing protein [Lachnospiraceae bacterium]|nr:ABC-F family ATP-binding cassette domain-containing protein [Lachnospiraceae bacterium]
MIKVENLSYSFPQKDLYNNISFTLENGKHCAFIGASGTGKSTLIDIIMKPDDYMYDGKIIIDPSCRIGYVSQFSQEEKTKDITVFDYIAEEFVRIQTEMNDICTQMETASDLEPLLERYQETLDAFSAIGGDDYESNITKRLGVAGLGKHENQLLTNLSGGEFKLIQVIKEMITNPNLIIMDEPDVFLDFEHLNGLKNLINSHKGTMLVITHNRYLLHHCFDKIIHLEGTELQEFDGRFIDYNFNLLQTKIELQEIVTAQEAEIERNRDMVDRLRFAATYYFDPSRGNTLNARVSLLERLEARKIKAPFVDIRQPKIHFPEVNMDIENADETAESAPVLKVNDYSVAFEETLLEHVNFEIGAHDKVALIGPNGTGKTTLLRDIYANKKDSIEIAEGVNTAFVSQLQGEMLNESNTVLDEFQESLFETRDEISSYLAAYGFEESTLNQKIAALSGGEKNLLQLAKICAGNANLLLLDEPTSHLDTYSQIALEEAIAEYNGAVLMISHDFYTIANCVDYVLLIEDKTIRKMSTRKFRKMIYENHFDKDYLENELKKKQLETRIAVALKNTDFTLAKTLCEDLEAVNKLL